MNIDINDYSTYLTEMDKSLHDKVTLLEDMLSAHRLGEIDAIVDYGCATGTVLRYLATKFPNIRYHGYDIDPTMIELAKQDPHPSVYINFSTELPRFAKDTKVLVIMSSIWHELFSYLDADQLNRSIDLLFDHVRPSYLYIRDMVMPSFMYSGYRPDEYKSAFEDMQVKINYSENPDHKMILSQLFASGRVSTIRDVGEFIMKYKFYRMGNWAKEMTESYFYGGLRDIESVVAYPMQVILHQFQTLPYIKEQVDKDFNIDYKIMTHYYALVKILY